MCIWVGNPEAVAQALGRPTSQPVYSGPMGGAIPSNNVKQAQATKLWRYLPSLKTCAFGVRTRNSVAGKQKSSNGITRASSALEPLLAWEQAKLPNVHLSQAFVLRNVYGWFTRIERGLYELTPEGAVALGARNFSDTEQLIPPC
jgi:Putative PD-(D/E)XK phosphodiesterase (DUF2161)